MYRIPSDLDLSPVVGEITTYISVGQFNLGFDFGPVSFSVQCAVELFRGGQLVGRWEEGRWPDPEFYNIMNVEVRRCDAVSDCRIVFEFESELEMRLEDDSDYYETMMINIDCDPPTQWII